MNNNKLLVILVALLFSHPKPPLASNRHVNDVICSFHQKICSTKSRLELAQLLMIKSLNTVFHSTRINIPWRIQDCFYDKIFCYIKFRAFILFHYSFLSCMKEVVQQFSWILLMLNLPQ